MLKNSPLGPNSIAVLSGCAAAWSTSIQILRGLHVLQSSYHRGKNWNDSPLWTMPILLVLEQNSLSLPLSIGMNKTRPDIALLLSWPAKQLRPPCYRRQSLTQTDHFTQGCTGIHDYTMTHVNDEMHPPWFCSTLPQHWPSWRWHVLLAGPLVDVWYELPVLIDGT